MQYYLPPINVPTTHPRPLLCFYKYIVSEVLDLLEDCGDYESADVYIEPSDVNVLTDEDSGDENEAGPCNFTGRQLRARAAVNLKGPRGKRIKGEVLVTTADEAWTYMHRDCTGK